MDPHLPNTSWLQRARTFLAYWAKGIFVQNFFLFGVIPVICISIIISLKIVSMRVIWALLPAEVIMLLVYHGVKKSSEPMLATAVILMINIFVIMWSFSVWNMSVFLSIVWVPSSNPFWSLAAAVFNGVYGFAIFRHMINIAEYVAEIRAREREEDQEDIELAFM